MKDRKDGYYDIKFNNEWRIAHWQTNQDWESSWSCWWIDGEEPKPYGWSDEELDFIDESSWSVGEDYSDSISFDI
jgi:hypothetical protein